MPAASLRRWKSWSLALALTLQVACSVLQTRPAAGLVPDLPPDTARVRQDGLSAPFATAEQRLAIQQDVADIIVHRYYDPRLNGIDWASIVGRYGALAVLATTDAEFYLVLKLMVRELNDSHTRVLTPFESLERRRYATLQTGATLAVVEDRLAIVDVDPDSPAARADLRRGDVVEAVDEVEFDADFFAQARERPVPQPDIASLEAEPVHPDEAARYAQLRAVRRTLYRGPDAPPADYRMRIERAGERREVLIASAPLVRPPEVRVQRLASGVAVLRLNHFTAGQRAEVARALKEVADAPALILDLRGNPGGDYSQFLWLARQFMPSPRNVLEVIERRGDTQARRPVELAAGDEPYLKPVAVLIDRRSASAAELLAVTLLEQRGALLVGESTCGCVVGVRAEYVLTGGGGVRVAETGFVSAGGRRLEGEPLAPTHYVAPTLADLRADRDRALSVAERELLAMH